MQEGSVMRQNLTLLTKLRAEPADPPYSGTTIEFVNTSKNYFRSQL